MNGGGRRGLIAWMVTNRVTPNLIMIVCLVGGAFMAYRIKKEVFPEFDMDTVTISVPYPGASPEEVERGIVLAVEEAVRGVDGVIEVTATANEGSGRVIAELSLGANRQQALANIQQEVDRIRTLPDEAEDPQVSLTVRRREVLDLQVYGDVTESILREISEDVRDRLLLDPRITQVELNNVRDYEIAVEIDQETLRTYGLTRQEVARRIGRTSLELPGGSLRTDGGEILLRVKERRDWAREFKEIPIVTTSQGTVVSLGDVATVKEDFEDSNRLSLYNGLPAIEIEVYRVGDQTPIGVSDAVREVLTTIEADLPPGVSYAVNRDRSDIYRQRLNLLVRNGLLGLGLVLLVLGLVLELRVALWVTIGIPTAFLGAFLFLPWFGVTINMISMFAFIIALGIVVDDAIVAGENIYEKRQQGVGFVRAAIEGAREVAVPITFSILTNIVAFAPLLFVPGFMGKIWRVIPLVVATVFVISWVESLIILPSHLAHGGKEKKRYRFLAPLYFWQRAFSGFTDLLRFRVYKPFLSIAARGRYVTLAVAIVTLILVGAYVKSGRIGFIFMPKVESDTAAVTARLPYGSPLARVEAVSDILVRTGQEVAAENGGDTLLVGIRSRINENSVDVSAYLTEPTVRPISTAEMTALWRERTGELPGLESLRFESDRGGPGRGPSVTVELSHRDITVLDRASAALADSLLTFGSIKDVDDGYSPGKPQLDFTLRPEGRSLGLTSVEVARQVRSAFYGTDALRMQRGRNEVRVRVRLPESQRTSEQDIQNLMIRTPSGRDVPLLSVADVTPGRAYTSIARRNGRRTVTVTANVDPISETSRVLESVKAELLPALREDYPGLGWSFEGRQAEMADGLEALKIGFVIALAVMYVLLAIPFKSYIQPVIVMIAIPFGAVGAIIGHEVMGFNISIISIMGMVALSGVVVNDSLVMIDLTNRLRAQGMDLRPAVLAAGVRRFRPILLTTLTTYGGLAPMIFETSRQARFMIPMAISLGYGILFATAITLVIVPSVYLIVEDMRRGTLRILGRSSVD